MNRSIKCGIAFVLLTLIAAFAACTTSTFEPLASAAPTAEAKSAESPVEASMLPANEATDEPSEAPNTTNAAPAVSDGYEKFSRLEIGMTAEEVKAIMGEPVRVDKAHNYFEAIVNGSEIEIEVWINTVTGKTTYFTASFYKKEYRGEFMDSATDLSGVKGLESGEIASYEDCVKAFKTNGYLVCMDESGVKDYIWVDARDGYMRVTFRADGTVKSYQGVC